MKYVLKGRFGVWSRTLDQKLLNQNLKSRNESLCHLTNEAILKK